MYYLCGLESTEESVPYLPVTKHLPPGYSEFFFFWERGDGDFAIGIYMWLGINRKGTPHLKSNRNITHLDILSFFFFREEGDFAICVCVSSLPIC